MTYDTPDLSVGGGFNASTGVFTVPADGIYTFNVSYYADGAGGSREVSIYVNSAPYEKIAIDITLGNYHYGKVCHHKTKQRKYSQRCGLYRHSHPDRHRLIRRVQG